MFANLLKNTFPAQFDHSFPGKRVALYFFYPLTALTLWRSQHHLFAPDGGAQSIATIPLDSYSTAASATVVGIFSLWGLSQLVVGLLYLIAAIRYRALIPLLYLLFSFEYAVRLWVGSAKPIETASTAPGAAINLPFLVIGLILFVLSTWPSTSQSAPE